jgi:hypothetical protein
MNLSGMNPGYVHRIFRTLGFQHQVSIHSNAIHQNGKRSIASRREYRWKSVVLDVPCFLRRHVNHCVSFTPNSCPKVTIANSFKVTLRKKLSAFLMKFMSLGLAGFPGLEIFFCARTGKTAIHATLILSQSRG